MYLFIIESKLFCSVPDIALLEFPLEMFLFTVPVQKSFIITLSISYEFTFSMLYLVIRVMWNDKAAIFRLVPYSRLP